MFSKLSMYARMFVLACAVVVLAGMLPAPHAGAQTPTGDTSDTADDGTTTPAADSEKKDVALPPGKVNPGDIGYTGYVTSSTDALARILNAVYMWSAIIATIVLVVAGYLFTTARGDPSQMKRSKDAIRGAVVGLVIVAIAFVITRFVIGGVQG